LHLAENGETELRNEQTAPTGSRTPDNDLIINLRDGSFETP
jgi:hypothetical protein